MKKDGALAGFLERLSRIVIQQAIRSVLTIALYVENVFSGVLGEQKNRVMFAREPMFGGSAGAIAPDDFVEKLFRAEDLFEHQADVMRRSPIEMDVKAAVIWKQAVHLFDARAQEFKIAGDPIGPTIVEMMLAGSGRSYPVRHERRINVDQITNTVWKTGYPRQVIAVDQNTTIAG